MLFINGPVVVVMAEQPVVIRHFLSSVFRDLVVKQISKTEGHGSVAKESQNAKKLPEHNGSGSRTQY